LIILLQVTSLQSRKIH